MNDTISPVPEKLDFKRVFPIFVIVLMDLLGLTIIIPLLPLYAAREGASAVKIGLLGAMYPIFQFIGAPFLGRLSDRYGRRPILLISQVGSFIGFCLLGVGNTLWVLFVARILDGISGANISTAQAAISDCTTEKTRTQGLGLIGAAFGLGFVAGPIIAFVSLSLSGNNYHVPAFIAAAFSLGTMLLTWKWFSETLPAEKRGAGGKASTFTLGAMLHALARPQIGFLILLLFVQQLAFGGFEQLLALFTLTRLGFNASNNAILFVFVGILVVAVQGGFIGPWSRKYGERKLIFAGLAALALGLGLTGLTPRQPIPGYSRNALLAELNPTKNFRTHENPTTREIVSTLTMSIPQESHKGWLGLGWILLAMVPAAIGGGVLQPSLNSLITQHVTPDEVGGTLGISAAFLSGANAVAPIIGGILFQTVAPQAPFIIGAVLLALLWLLALALLHPGQEAASHPPASPA